MQNYNHSNELYHHGIKGMRWGIRRYQNDDGSLTSAGQKRYARDAREKEFNKYDSMTGKYYKSSKKNGRTDLEADANRYVKEDLSRTRKLIDETANLTRNLKTANDQSIKNKSKTRMKLDNMTDQQMRERINRELLERQYNDIFNPQTTSNGRQYASRILETTGAVLGVASSALSIALAINELKG